MVREMDLHTAVTLLHLYSWTSAGLSNKRSHAQVLLLAVSSRSENLSTQQANVMVHRVCCCLAG